MSRVFISCFFVGFTIAIPRFAGALECNSGPVFTALFAVLGLMLFLLCFLYGYICRKKKNDLKMELERLRAGVDNLIRVANTAIPASFCFVDQHDTVSAASRHLLRQLGVTADEIKGKPLADFMTPENYEKLELPAFLEKPDGPYASRWLVSCKDRPCPAPMETEQKEQTGEDANERAIENLAHDIRTPLNSILGFSQILMNRMESEDIPVYFREMLNNIRKSSQELTISINSLIESFKPGSSSFADQELKTGFSGKEVDEEDMTYSSDNKILVVDDNLVNQDILISFFHDLELEVFTASNGVEGVEKTRELIPDLVLMDIKMPKMDGMKAVHQIRLDRKTRSVPVIALSANTAEEKREEALQAGFDGYFAKPFDLDDLYPILNRYLKKESVNVKEKKVYAEVIPEQIRMELAAAFQALAVIPKDYSNALIEALEEIKVLVQPVNSGFMEVLQEIENAVYECNDSKLDRLINEQLEHLTKVGSNAGLKNS